MIINRKYYSIWHIVRYVLILFLLPSSVLANVSDKPGNSPVFHAGTEAAYESARKDDSLVLLVFRAKWCVFCKAFNKTTLESEEFRKSRSRVHVALIDIDAHKKLAKEFNIKSVPDSVLLSSDGKIIDRRRGLMEPAELLLWIAQAEQKAERGEWTGFSPSGEFGKFLERFDKGRPSDADYKRLVKMLGSKIPGDRVLAAKVALSQGERVMPFLIDAAEDKYLGLRVGVNDILSKLAPKAPSTEPWASEEERTLAVARIRSWWAKTGKLSTDPDKFQDQPTHFKSVRNALNAVLSNDPVRRTKAMTFLVEMGHDVLPDLREAIRQSESRGDHKSVWALEDIRWTILTPPKVARKIPGIRRTLARGSSRERQEAAEYLGNIGSSALPVLTELIRDTDPLVQEIAVHSVAKTDADEVLEVMAVLLESENANLRMVAAQLLGKTGKKDAVKYLVRVLADPDEVVAGTAIAALKELEADNVENDLIACLKDSRWRIRAAAAEAIGELKVSAAGDSLKKLVQDPDPFVIKSAVVALSGIGFPLGPEEIRTLIIRNPDLITVGISQILDNESKEAIHTLGVIFEEMNLRQKMILLDMLSQAGSYNEENVQHWKPLFEKFLAHKEPGVRLKAVKSLAKGSMELASDFLTEILRDTDADINQAGFSLALALVCYHYGYEGQSERSDYAVLSFREKILSDPKSKEFESFDIRPEDIEKKKQRAEVIFERHQKWHNLLLEDKEGFLSLEKTLALYLTGQHSENIAYFKDTLTEKNVQDLLKKEFGSYSLRLTLSRLPWPESETLVRELVKTPNLYAVLAAFMDKADPGLTDYMLDEKYLSDNLKRAEDESLKLLTEALLAPAGSRAASLLSHTEKAHQLSLTLMNSSDPFLKSIGTEANSKRETVVTEQFTELLKDRNPWVRRAAIMVIARRTEELEKRESFLGNMLKDEASEVVQAALVGLLTRDICQKAGFHTILARYKYEHVELDPHRITELVKSERPLSIIRRKPAFLDQAWQLFESMDKSKEKYLIKSMIVVLMAQYGEFKALDIALRDWVKEKPDSLGNDLFTAIELSRDAKYLPVLREYAERKSDKYELRRVLRGIRRMRGKEVRLFRRDLNKRLRMK